ncbi:PHA/PHB synthase family protein [Azospirillum brasilense]|nr:class I poly(R)-hydroxyalkanoic acid synthase [Azospirillum brasilense]
MEANVGAVRDWSGAVSPWWQVSPDDLAGTRRLNDILANDPVLRSIDGLWSANPFRTIVPVDWAEVARALRTVWMLSLSRPDKAARQAADVQAAAWTSAMEAWNDAGRRWWGISGGKLADGARSGSASDGDKRFAAPEWHANPAYRTLKEMYLLASDWLLEQGERADGLDDAERRRLTFHLRQFVDAMSPTLLLFSNPAALRRVLETGGVSLADGARNLLSDLREGRLSMVDATAFELGRNLATTPGKVVHRNRLIELIQYQPQYQPMGGPAGGAVHAVPLLILPPWINKYYILDLQPKNSMVRHLVEQGFTVFVISWKNPDASMDGVGFDDYMDLGPLEAADVVRDITGAASINVMGYCIGGTLLAITLAWLAAKGDNRFNAATFMVSLQDFSHVGDTAVFMGEPAVDFVEQQMMERGYLDSREMSNMFNLLRSNDLIWSNVVNNYLMGNKPPAFDLLYWNSDGTRMARAAHSWYLRNTYVENNLIAPGKVRIKGEAIDLGRIPQDVYAVGAEKDHIVPWDSAWRVTQLLKGSKVRYVLASSGHIAGIINPPGGKGTYRTNGAGEPGATAQAWREKATAHSGSWWTDWTAWLAERSGRKGKPPALGSATHPALADAPGTYVLEK